MTQDNNEFAPMVVDNTELPAAGEISDAELEQVSGGAKSRYSKTIDLVQRCTDVDDGF